MVRLKNTDSGMVIEMDGRLTARRVKSFIKEARWFRQWLSVPRTNYIMIEVYIDSDLHACIIITDYWIAYTRMDFNQNYKEWSRCLVERRPHNA